MISKRENWLFLDLDRGLILSRKDPNKNRFPCKQRSRLTLVQLPKISLLNLNSEQFFLFLSFQFKHHFCLLIFWIKTFFSTYQVKVAQIKSIKTMFTKNKISVFAEGKKNVNFCWWSLLILQRFLGEKSILLSIKDLHLHGNLLFLSSDTHDNLRQAL